MEHATFQNSKINRFQQSVTFNRSNIPKVDLKTLSFQESILHRHWNSTTETWELCLGFTWWVGVRVQRYSKESGVYASQSLPACFLCFIDEHSWWWTGGCRAAFTVMICSSFLFDISSGAISESNSVRY